jgi:NADPH:quinone reductase-like Zn-dependent oxidoreductase
VLNVIDVPRPEAGPGQVLVQVKAASINPGEAKIRDGLLHARWPATFPSGQGSDLAGIVARAGPGVTGFAAGDEVIGFTDDRASQAEYAVVDAAHLTSKPARVPWEVAGSLFVVGATAWAAVRAVGLTAGHTVVVSAAAARRSRPGDGQISRSRSRSTAMASAAATTAAVTAKAGR